MYGATGCLMEVFWTGLGSLIKKNFRLISTTSIWMFLIYGLAVALEPVCDLLRGYSVIFRGTVYMVCIFAVEYVTGMLLKKFNLCPWDYSASRFSVQGVIRLDFAPAWFAAGLVFEWMHFKFQLFSIIKAS